jgi:hypothetical protein
MYQHNLDNIIDSLNKHHNGINHLSLVDEWPVGLACKLRKFVEEKIPLKETIENFAKKGSDALNEFDNPLITKLFGGAILTALLSSDFDDKEMPINCQKYCQGYYETDLYDIDMYKTADDYCFCG